MLMPSTNVMNRFFGGSLLDDFLGIPFPERRDHEMMSTDVKETEDGYEVIINLPGFDKENIKGEIKDGYLTISASMDSSSDDKDENGRYIRRERYMGACSRSFYVGDALTQEDIKANFKNGTLHLTIPKKDPTANVEQKHYISIEG